MLEVLFWIGTIPVGAFLGALRGISVNGDVETRMAPNRGIRRSAIRAMLTGAATLVVATFAVGLTFLALALVRVYILDRDMDSSAAMEEALRLTILFVKVAGTIVAFTMGGEAAISHLLLRLCLWRAGVMPLRYVRFLNHATDRILMRRVGGGYQFVHRLVREHIAEHEDELVRRVSESGAPATTPA